MELPEAVCSEFRTRNGKKIDSTDGSNHSMQSKQYILIFEDRVMRRGNLEEIQKHMLDHYSHLEYNQMEVIAIEATYKPTFKIDIVPNGKITRG